MTPPRVLSEPSRLRGVFARPPPRTDLLSMKDFGDDLPRVLEAARALKRASKAGRPVRLLEGRSAVLIFEKPSTRTRVSFEIGASKLGMTVVFLSSRDIHLGSGSESIEDSALVLSRYTDVLIYRAFRSDQVSELAAHASVPVINALDNREHPCQVTADLLTILEHKGRLRGIRFLYIGDGNNMCHSYLMGGALVGMDVTISTPPSYAPNPSIVKEAREMAEKTGASITLVHDPEGVFENKDVIATDTWVSMGDEEEREERLKAFQGWTVTKERMERSPEAIFLHCLPAYYGNEVTHEVLHGPRSVVFDEAENRMWAQMAILVWLIRGEEGLRAALLA